MNFLKYMVNNINKKPDNVSGYNELLMILLCDLQNNLS
jgi:hypothetical protein